MTEIKLAIFASGSGTNAEQIIKYFADHSKIKVAAIYTNNPRAPVIERAEKHKVPVVVFNRQQLYKENTVIASLLEKGIGAVVLAGFLWLIPSKLIQTFPQRIINIHPALLPRYGGKGMYGMNVHNAVIAAGESQSGITIHEVNEKYDEGRILFQTTCAIEPGETPESLVRKIHKLEHRHYGETIEKWLQ